MSAKKATKTTLGVTVYVLIVLAIIAVVGLIFQLTNGFTDKVKTFYVTVIKPSLRTLPADTLLPKHDR